MKLKLLKIFYSEYKKRKKKTSLITFAIIWGTISLLMLIAFGQGMTNQFQKAFKGLGENLIMVFGGQTSKLYKGLPKGRDINLNFEDLALLKKMIPEIKELSPENMSNATISKGKISLNKNISGVYPAFKDMRSQIVQRGGRFIDSEDIKNRRRVVFIGWKLAKELFGSDDPVGKMVLIEKIPFKVIGVLEKKLQNSMYSGPDSEKAIIPYPVFISVFSSKYVERIHIMPRSKDYAKYIEKRVKEVLGVKYGFDPKDDYAIEFWNLIENENMTNKIYLGFELFLGIIGILSLLIAAVGVTNLMYAIVKERTREIGVKMALGAKKKHIISQFLFETFIIFSKGAFWGFFISFDIIGLIRLIPIKDDNSVMAYMGRPVFSLETAIIFLFILGILVFFSGIFPASRAAKLNPVEALRYE